MASTTFVNYQTVIDAGWLNDVNSAVYSGTFQASTITPTNVTSSGAISGATVAGTTSVTTPIVKSGTSLTLQTNGSTSALTLSTSGNATFNQSNAGIIFNNSGATTNSTLNDYEVGTWTPTANSASGSITAYTAFGTYTKIGRLVLLQGNVTITTPGTATGQLQIQGLPFTAINSGTAGLTQFTGTCRETANTGVIYYVLSNINNTTAAIQNATNGGIVYLATYCYTFSISYEANF
jgi:hypothetical protein